MKTEKINPKGERKVGDRKKQGRRYFKPSNKKSENTKSKNNSEKELNKENTPKNTKNVNIDLQILADKYGIVEINVVNFNGIITYDFICKSMV